MTSDLTQSFVRIIVSMLVNVLEVLVHHKINVDILKLPLTEPRTAK
jgi:hypothetical protein